MRLLGRREAASILAPFRQAGDIPGEIAGVTIAWLKHPSPRKRGEGVSSEFAPNPLAPPGRGVGVRGRYPTKLKNAANSSAWVESPNFR
jgi:hypothetical protein